jgi:hypothetical protein
MDRSTSATSTPSRQGDTDGHVHGAIRAVRPTGLKHVNLTVELSDASTIGCSPRSAERRVG